ncbi:glycosyltransferase family 2 protein [Elizabethkingia anophelis]|uniref:glycosyltransferase family 2 protein n=1 Tax=Elizabethkingia anophelis TaxID=1117645 RepID=UPI00200C2A8C|nr:glycosyltransferase family 2 protein [Elizabethkingia anophelis]MCL1033638.1 glycosyltransferase family 2 protein [Elizabethkingia anophelis]MCW2463790.1 glycosyltransferase involved in cell wall biosynthesis [Elizabethkingia anophelis]MCW2467474.1 glycosyltransferase involved in cell wall biosynthesis [Elizabethkingia anophelis]MCW2470378.1 glycosyltransferase involved in cell wall biosynthesis [Elizabethkingia anophelis]HBI9692030.1 glycosyltransferase family 2 protein [Elizabethkingia an
MKFLIIVPTHNEEENVLQCLESLRKQSFQDFLCVIVNDGSTDKTKVLVEHFIENIKLNGSQSSPFTLLNLPKSEHQPGAKVVRTFNKGLEGISLDDYDIVCKFDADIIFPENYLEKVNRVYEENSKAGMVSGLVYIEKNSEWIFENLSSKNHVRGPIKSYRVTCFKEMNGLRPVLGWDNIDVMLAQMHGWDVITIKDIWVKHLRPTAYKYKKQKAEKLGQYFYNIGLNFPLAFVSSAKSSLKNKSLSEFFITMKSFLKQNSERVLSPQEIAYIRSLRWDQMLRRK